MACFSLFKALHTHWNDSTRLPSFPLSSSACLENKEMIHGGRRRGSSGVQREGRGSGMGDLWTTADKLTNNKREEGSRCRFLHWISLNAESNWIQTGSSTPNSHHWLCSYLPTGSSGAAIGGLSPWERGQGQGRDDRLTRSGVMSWGRTSWKGTEKWCLQKNILPLLEKQSLPQNRLWLN